MKTVDGEPLEAGGTLENSPSVLFDGLVLPDGEAGVAALARHGKTMEFIDNQYRHGKTILALGASARLLDDAAITSVLPSGKADAGVVLANVEDFPDAGTAFMAALGKHRHEQREVIPQAE